MKGLMKSAAGLALMLGWWTLTGDGDDPNHESASSIPTTVWEGGGAFVEFGAVDPKPGDELRWTVAVDGETVDEQTEALEKPLEENYAFFLQAYFDDYASGTLAED